MKSKQILPLSALLFLFLQSCISPMNMAYENAAPIGQNATSISAAYAVTEEGSDTGENFETVQNYMFKMGFGLSEKTSLYLGYYHKGERRSQTTFFDPDDYAFAAYNYLEAGAKFTLTARNDFAMKTMVGGYRVDGRLVAYSIYGSFIYTYFHPNEKFELSVIGHGTGIYEFNGVQLLPGLNINAGFSSNLKLWAIRPEVGFNLRSLNAGIGIELILGNRN